MILTMESKKPVTQDADKYVVRFPPGVRETIAAVAKKNGRSMNAEIVARLERTLREDFLEKDMEASPQFMTDFISHMERVMARYKIEPRDKPSTKDDE